MATLALVFTRESDEFMENALTTHLGGIVSASAGLVRFGPRAEGHTSQFESNASCPVRDCVRSLYADPNSGFFNQSNSDSHPRSHQTAKTYDAA